MTDNRGLRNDSVMSDSQDDAHRCVEQAIVGQRAIPVVRAASADSALDTCARLIAGGVEVIELTTTIPDWKTVIKSLRHDFPAATIGMGTVHTARDATDAVECGAAFIVSPFPAEEARQASTASGALFIGGGMTPGEISASSRHGICKLFPAHLGGLSYLRSLKSIMPSARIMPTGGIKIGQVAAWLAEGATAVGIGADLYAADDLDATLAALRAQLMAEGDT